MLPVIEPPLAGTTRDAMAGEKKPCAMDGASRAQLLEAAQDVWRLNELLLNDIVKLTNSAAQEGDLQDISTPLQIEHALERCRADLRHLTSGGGGRRATMCDQQVLDYTVGDQQGAVDADGWPIERCRTLRTDSVKDYLNCTATNHEPVNDDNYSGPLRANSLARGDSVNDYVNAGKYEPNARNPAHRNLKAEHHLLFLVHGIGQHNDFGTDEESTQANGTEPCYRYYWPLIPTAYCPLSPTAGPNHMPLPSVCSHDFKRQIEAMREARLGEAPLELSVRSIEWHSVMHRFGQDELLDACSPGFPPSLSPPLPIPNLRAPLARASLPMPCAATRILCCPPSFRTPCSPW